MRPRQKRTRFALTATPRIDLRRRIGYQRAMITKVLVSRKMMPLSTSGAEPFCT